MGYINCIQEGMIYSLQGLYEMGFAYESILSIGRYQKVEHHLKPAVRERAAVIHRPQPHVVWFEISPELGGKMDGKWLAEAERKQLEMQIFVNDIQREIDAGREGVAAWFTAGLVRATRRYQTAMRLVMDVTEA